MLAPIASESSSLLAEFIMATFCKICAGLIEPPDQHDHCLPACALPTPRRALAESNCWFCTDLPACVLRTSRDVARGLFRVRPTAANVLLVGPPPSGDGSVVFLPRKPQRSTRSPVSFPGDCFRPLSNITEFVSFGREEGDDSMLMRNRPVGTCLW